MYSRNRLYIENWFAKRIVNQYWIREINGEFAKKIGNLKWIRDKDIESKTDLENFRKRYWIHETVSESIVNLRNATLEIQFFPANS